MSRVFRKTIVGEKILKYKVKVIEAVKDKNIDDLILIDNRKNFVTNK